MDITFAEAIAGLGLSADDAEAQRVLVSIQDNPGGKPIVITNTLTKLANRPLSQYDDKALFYTQARFDPSQITRYGGRTKENARSCDAFVFDADLKDYLGKTHEELQRYEHHELDEFIQLLMEECHEYVVNRCGIAINRVDSTGYGCALSGFIHESDRGRVSDIAEIHKHLVERINAEYGGHLVDPGVNDVLTRIMRLPGSQNHKGRAPRPCYTLWSSDGSTHLDAYPRSVAPAPRRAPHKRVAEKRLDASTVEEIVAVVSGAYEPGLRNAVSLGLSAMLFKAGVPRDQGREIIAAIACEDEELENRLSAFERTYDNGEAGRPISGYRRLANHLPEPVRDMLDRKLNRFRQATLTAAMLRERPPEETAPRYDGPPAACYYGLSGEYRNLVAPCTSGADQYHLAAWLNFAGITIGRRAWVHHAGVQYPILYTVLVGETGDTKKDTCVDMARRHFALQERMVGSVGTVVPYGVLENLSTWEGLLAHMHNEQRNRIMVRTREFDLFLGKAARETGNGLLPGITGLWDGKETEDLPTRKDPLKISCPWVSLISTVTPYILASKMDPGMIHSGFANRVLWVFGTGKGHIADPPEVDRTGSQLILSEFLANTGRVTSPAQGGTRFTRDPHAQAMWAEWSRKIHDANIHLNPDDRELSQRMEPQVARISLIHALSDGASSISELHLDAAIQFVEWSVVSACQEARLWGSGDEAKLMQAILQLLAVKPMSRNEIITALPRWGPSFLEKTVRGMLSMDRVIEDPSTSIIRTAAYADLYDEVSSVA